MPGVTPATAGSCDASPRAGRRVDRDRHSADRQRPVARHQSGDRSQARRCRRSGLPNTEEARKRAHLAADFPQHPVCRHIAVAVLMALSAMGVQIAPLRAGAGSSVSRWVLFYLLDDAFRVGGYPGRPRQGHCRGVQHPFGQAAASPRPGFQCAVQPIGCGQLRAAMNRRSSDEGKTKTTASLAVVGVDTARSYFTSFDWAPMGQPRFAGRSSG